MRPSASSNAPKQSFEVKTPFRGSAHTPNNWPCLFPRPEDIKKEKEQIDSLTLPYYKHSYNLIYPKDAKDGLTFIRIEIQKKELRYIKGKATKNIKSAIYIWTSVSLEMVEHQKHTCLSCVLFMTDCAYEQKSKIQTRYIIMERLHHLQLESQLVSQDLFGHVQEAPKDPILWTRQAFQNDQSEEKVNLGQGVYRDNDGKPFVFAVVKKIEQKLLKSPNHEYLDMDGLPEFVSGARNLLFGADCQAVKDHRIASLQSISGTGALAVAFDFIAKYLPRIVYISSPTWAIHRGLIEKHHLKALEYPYYSPKLKGIDFEAMLKGLQNAVPGSYVLLHPSAHNPTGFDLNQEQWKRVAEVMKKNSLIPFFDTAYQGFATGNFVKDAWAVRYFTDQGFQLFAAQSFAKNMGLYGQRVGALHVVLNSKETAQRILSQMKVIVRAIYSSPSKHGATIAATILNNPEHFKEWETELRDVVAARIKEMRVLLRAELQKIATPGTWNHITEQIGMFSFTGLSQRACQVLTDKYHVYLLKSGRISMSGINKRNVKYLAQAIKNALKETA